MMEIKCYKSTLIESHFIFFNLGPTCPGPSFMGPICRGPIWQRTELSSSLYLLGNLFALTILTCVSKGTFLKSVKKLSTTSWAAIIGFSCGQTGIPPNTKVTSGLFMGSKYLENEDFKHFYFHVPVLL